MLVDFSMVEFWFRFAHFLERPHIRNFLGEIHCLRFLVYGLFLFLSESERELAFSGSVEKRFLAIRVAAVDKWVVLA